MPTKTKQPQQMPVILAAIPAMADSRYMVSFDHEGNPRVTPIAADAYVMSMKEMLEAINKNIIMDTEMLAEFAVAAAKTLQYRCNHVNNLRTVNEV